jgi:hypothetical protein
VCVAEELLPRWTTGIAPGRVASRTCGTRGQDEQLRELVESMQKAGPILSEFVHEGKVKIVGAYYDLVTAKVELLPSAKHQAAARGSGSKLRGLSILPLLSSVELRALRAAVGRVGWA